MKKSMRNVWVAVIVLLAWLLYDAYEQGVIRIYTEDTTETKAVATSTPVGRKGAKSFNRKREKNIRVLLTTTNFSSYYHTKVVLQGTKGIKVKKNGKTEILEKGQLFQCNAKDVFDTITIEPLEKGKIRLLSIKRQDAFPLYRGSIQLTSGKEGIVIVNKLPLEQYLYGVVPSEISGNSAMEALKAQAVCARSYAYLQMAGTRYKKYHADVEDSVSCQVYNNVTDNARVRKAVKETKGQIVTCQGKKVQTYYYSTSWGKSASGKQVWQMKQNASYLQSCMQQEKGGHGPNLSTEDAFRNFLQKQDEASYDKDSPWYRWQIFVDSQNIEDRLDATLQTCYEENQDAVLVQKEDGTYQHQKLVPMGKIKKIRVETRESSGLVTSLVLVGEKQIVKVSGQHTIRKVLSWEGMEVTLQNGKKAKVSMLPSAAVYIDKETRDGKNGFRFTGGGFGHGTGMSQTGAAKMASMGKNYREILQFYYSGCEVTEG